MYEHQEDYESYYQDPQYYDDFPQQQALEKHPMQEEITKSFDIFDREELIKKIEAEIKELAELTALSFQWAFQLYYLCSWNKSICYKLLEQGLVKKQLNFTNEQTQQIIGKNVCQICLQDNRLLKNPCSHSFCLNCWRQYLQFLLNYDHTLFPQCMQSGCHMKINMKLINIIFSTDHLLKNKFYKVLCKSYSQLNKKVTACPNTSCDKFIYCNFYKENSFTCRCGTIICSQCGKQQHIPADCADLANWTKIYNDKKNQWINIVQTKTCPHCKQPVQKNEGCNHMTCHCKGQFCWICGKKWNTHDPNYCPFRLQYQRLQQQRKKRFSNEKQYMLQYESTKQIFDRRENQLKQIKKIDIEKIKDLLINNVHILNVDCLFLFDIWPFLQQSLRYIQWAVVQKFFKRFSTELLEIQINKMTQISNILDEHLRVFIPKIVKQAKIYKVTNANQIFMTERKKILEIKSQGVYYLQKLLEARSNI